MVLQKTPTRSGKKEMANSREWPVKWRIISLLIMATSTAIVFGLINLLING